MSYCAESCITPETYSKLVKTNPDVDAIYITDHGMAVYFPSDVAWSWSYMTDSRIFDAQKDWGNKRLDAHLANIARFKDDGIHSGLEVEMMHDGRLTIDDPFRDKVEILIGSVHYLPIDIEEEKKKILKEWKKHTINLLNTGISILGHPFRWISSQIEVDRKIIREIVKEAKKTGVAMELNGHHVVPTDIGMLQECVEQGVPVAIGTDAHAMGEIGDFSYHIEIIGAAGLKMTDIKMFTPKAPSKTGKDV